MRNSEHNPLGFSISVRNCDADSGVHIKHYKIEYIPKNIEETLVYMFIMHSFLEPLFVVMRIVYQHIRGFLILNFRRVLIVVSFVLGKYPASVYYCMPTFRNSLSVPSSKAMEPLESSETSAYNNTLMPGTCPKEKKLHIRGF